jgi:hypothetical protein
VEIGKTFSVPDERLRKAVTWTRKIHDRFGTAEADSLVVAQALGHASVGGAFNSKMAVMTSYGLIERGQGKVRVTDIARMLVSPRTTKESAEGAKAALQKVSLWQRLYKDYTSKSLTIPADFAQDLAKISGVAINDARNKSEWVANAYADDLAFAEEVENQAKAPAISPPHATATASEPARQATEAVAVGGSTGIGEVGEGQIHFMSPQDKIQISVPRNARHIAMLRTVIESALSAIEEDVRTQNPREKPRKQAEK